MRIPKIPTDPGEPQSMNTAPLRANPALPILAAPVSQARFLPAALCPPGPRYTETKAIRLEDRPRTGAEDLCSNNSKNLYLPTSFTVSVNTASFLLDTPFLLVLSSLSPSFLPFLLLPVLWSLCQHHSFIFPKPPHTELGGDTGPERGSTHLPGGYRDPDGIG